MVSNEEIKQMLDAKRKGINIKNDKIKSENYKICLTAKLKIQKKHCSVYTAEESWIKI